MGGFVVYPRRQCKAQQMGFSNGHFVWTELDCGAGIRVIRKSLLGIRFIAVSRETTQIFALLGMKRRNLRSF